MQESQNIEWKEKWKDDYLKWICGFANASGGKIIIGKNDKGEIIGLQNSKKLLEDIPNKVRDILGIMVDVNLHKTEKGDFLEIIVDPQPFPVNYKGQYHYRSGSTKQELKGAALDKFMLGKKGKKWDAVPVPNVSVNNLKNETFEFFKKRAIISKRIDESILTENNINILENLRLIEKRYLKRASILLFYPDPEKYVTGSFHEEYLKKLKLNERQLEALLLWKKEKEITNLMYSKNFSITDRTSLRDLNDLVAKGLLKKVGEKKKTKYQYKL